MCRRTSQLPDNPNLPNIGVTNSANVTLASNGQGSGSGMGTGYGGGLGSGHGNGFGPGTGGNTGGGVYHDRRRRFGAGSDFHAGSGVLRRGAAGQVSGRLPDFADRGCAGQSAKSAVIRALGMGLDEKALEAVRKYKFKPAMKDGRTPVPVMITHRGEFPAVLAEQGSGIRIRKESEAHWRFALFLCGRRLDRSISVKARIDLLRALSRF